MGEAMTQHYEFLLLAVIFLQFFFFPSFSVSMDNNADVDGGTRQTASSSTNSHSLIWARFEGEQEAGITVPSLDINIEQLKEQIISSKKLPQISNGTSEGTHHNLDVYFTR